jgi:chemotaxis protein histidine kinase CheA
LTFTQDLELQRLFGGEVEERAEALVRGARALGSNDTSEALYQDMYREGHTIKGTARMMGYLAVSDAGKLLEDAWKAVRNGEQAPSEELAQAFENLSLELLPAIAADPVTGTPELAAGMRALREAMKESSLPGEPEDSGVASRSPSEPGDLGGLLGTIDSWGFGENVRVNAAGLFRLINEICSLRVDAEALRTSIETLETSVGDQSAMRESLIRLNDLIVTAEKSVIDLQNRAVELAEAPLSEITRTYPQLVRYLARRAGKDIRFELVGDHHPIDRQVAERLSDPLRHLIVNSVEHGVEPSDERQAFGKAPTATLSVRFDVTDHRLTVVVEDDGAGIDWAAVRATAVGRGLLDVAAAADPEQLRAVLFSSHFSTTGPNELVGDGMGLSNVAGAVEALHGTLVLESEAGTGTTVTITVPTSHALQDAVLVRSAGETWGIPEIAVLDRLSTDKVEIVTTDVRTEMRWDGATVPVISFADAVGLNALGDPTCMLVVSSPGGPVAFAVEKDLGRRQVAARELGPILDGVPHLTGAALLGGGDIVVLVDVARLADRARQVPGGDVARPRVLVVDDSRGARQVVGGALGSSGFDVDLAGSPTEALSVLAEVEFDAIVLDYVLPTMDGATLAGRVRALGITAPIVILSGAATAEDQEKAKQAGADAYLDKDDVRQGALATQIRELLE